MVAMLVQIHLKRKARLFKIGKADRLLALLLRAVECGQQQRGKNRNDLDDHQRFNQREATPGFFHMNRSFSVKI